MRAECHAQHTDRSAEGDSCTISGRSPRRGSQSCRRQRPECRRALPAYKRAIAWAFAARIPPGNKPLVTAELRNVDRPRARPFVFEPRIDDQARRQHQSDEEENHRARGDHQPPPRQDEFGDERQQHRHDNADDDVGAGLARRHHPAARKELTVGGEEKPRRCEIEFRIHPEQRAHHSGDRERDKEPGAVHAAGLSHVHAEGKPSATDCRQARSLRGS